MKTNIRRGAFVTSVVKTSERRMENSSTWVWRTSVFSSGVEPYAFLVSRGMNGVALSFWAIRSLVWLL